jgi:hypothetical protein
MFIILGLVILVAAVVVGVAGVVTNHGTGHVLTHRFTVFGYHLNGSTGRLFLYGIVVGAVAVFGLSLLLSAARRTSRRGSVARQGLHQSRDETAAVSDDRDDLVGQRDDLVGQRDDLVGQRDDLVGQRDDLVGQRDDLIQQRENARVEAASAATNGAPAVNGSVDADDDRHRLLHPFGHRTPAPAATAVSEDR